MENSSVLYQDIGSLSFGCESFASTYERLKAAIARWHLATAEHSVRVRISCVLLGSTCGMAGDELTTLSIAAEVHDIGKLNVPKSILDAPRTLTEAEWVIIREHPTRGAQLAALSFPSMPDIAKCVLLHHERLDGSGYPNGLNGNQIPLLPRIIAVADAFVALTEDRPFRSAYSKKDALQILMHEESGKFDEQILKLLERSMVSLMS